MPNTARTVPKKKPNAKPPPKKNTPAKAKAKQPGSNKRSTRDDDPDSEEEEDLSNMKKKRRRTEPDVEVVDEDVEPEIVEDVEDGVGAQEPADEQDVSTSHIS
jgi:hypothetical protein